jgi:signal transduction histidine kinase/ligand-binding sensor domain-containing protein/DNA-binding NarL/FixJ family response regulator
MLVFSLQSGRKAPFLVSFLLAIASPGGEAAPFDRSVPARVMQTWTVDDGLPINSITGIVQDEDGFLWLSTLGGLVRFDGLEFTTFDSQTFPGLPSDRLTALHRTPDGTLWMTTEQHDLVKFDGERFHRLDDDPRFSREDVVRTASRPDGWLAFGTRRGAGIIGTDGPKWLLPEEISGPVEAVLWSETGRLWVASEGTLRSIDDPLSNEPRIQSWTVEAETLVLAEDDDTLWIGTAHGLLSLSNDVIEAAHPDLPDTRITRLDRSDDGVLYVDAGEVWSLTEGQAELRGREHGSSWRERIVIPFANGRHGLNLGRTLITPRGDRIELPAPIRVAALDREGNTWLAPSGEGLMLWRESSFRVLGTPEGLPGDRAYPILEALDGSIWVGVMGAGAARIPTRGEPIESYTEIDPVWSIAEIDGVIWLAGVGLCRVEKARCIPEASPEFREFRLIHQTRTGRVLLAGSQGTLFERVGNAWERLDDTIPDWPVKQPIRTVVEDDDGTLWLGTNGSGVARLRGDEVVSFDTSSGLSSDLIRALHLDGRGNLLIGTENRGLCRLRLADQQVDCIDRKQRLYSAGIHHIASDDRGRLWISSNQGIFWVDHDELLAVMDRRAGSLTRGGSFNGHNGMRSSEANGGVFPSGTTDRQRRLWWPTQGGLVIIDPESDLIEVPAVSSRIKKIVAGDRELVFDGERLELPAGARTLQLELWAPSYFDPPAVEFRLRIPRISGEWIELGRSRAAGPIVLPRGDVIIETAARNAGGGWQDVPTRMQLFVPPLWHERTSTRLSLVMTTLLLLGFVVWSRDLRASRRALALEREVAARTAEVRQQKEAIAELSQRRTDLFANIAHELRTPLTLVLGPLEDASDAGKELEPSAIAMMARSARRMRRLVNQILDLQKLDSHELSIELEQIELVGFVMNACRPFALLAEQTGIRFATRSELSRALIDADREQLEKILANLLSNAFKFSPAGAPVDLLIRGDDGTVELVVSDSGRGIPEDKLERIFERFYQVDGGLTRATEGSGIGLSLALELARLHGGDIAAENRSEGGARFTLRMPCNQIVREETRLEPIRSEPAAPLVSDNDSAVSEHAPRTVLVVEDDLELQSYICSCIRDRYQTLRAGNGKEGLAMARSHLPDLVISDVMMPDGDGLEMLRELRSDPDTRSIPVILLTARGLGVAELEGLRSGADDYIAKPFNRQSLRARIEARFSVGQRLAEAVERAQSRAVTSPLPAEDEMVEKARLLIRKRIEDPEFGVGELAEELFMSRSSLHRWMVSTLDTTPGFFIREIRLRTAADLLQQGFSASEVGIATGFASLASFSHSFKAAYGLSPSLYAERERESA